MENVYSKMCSKKLSPASWQWLWGGGGREGNTGSGDGDFNNFTLVLEEGISEEDLEDDGDGSKEDVKMKDESSEQAAIPIETHDDNKCEQDTPELEDILIDAEKSNIVEAGTVPDEVMKILRQNDPLFS